MAAEHCFIVFGTENVGMKRLQLHVVILSLIWMSMHMQLGAFNVSYDHRSLILDGQRRILISGSIHYPRATPGMWPGLVAKAKEGGLDVIQTYVFWNIHEPSQGRYNFEGSYDLVKFVKIVQSEGLFLSLRIGPFVSAEWNFGGLPFWLREIDGIHFRTDNDAFKREMQRFVALIVKMMKQEKLFSWQGGPIILAQVENEYGITEEGYGSAGKSYVSWAAEMVENLQAGVPWIMCKQADAPGSIINTWNDFYVDADFKPNNVTKPKMWTENWTGWFHQWGTAIPHRPAEDIAFAVGRFFGQGGSFQNYYMYFGGTNFGRTAGGPFITTSYDYDAPLDEYGLAREPKWGHLRDLHKAIKLCEPAMVLTDPTTITLGPSRELYLYNSSSACAAFLANYDSNSTVTIQFNEATYELPPWSLSILPGCRNVVFNTAKVGVQTNSFSAKLVENKVTARQSWESYQEPIGIWGEHNASSYGLVEHLAVTKDMTDYLWYTTSLQISEEELVGKKPVLAITSMRDALLIYVNQKLAGSINAADPFNFRISISQPITLKPGTNNIALLSMTVGLQNAGFKYETWAAGIAGSVTLEGLASATRNLTSQNWIYQAGLKGESKQLFTESGSKSVSWFPLPKDPSTAGLIWYKREFDAFNAEDPVMLNLGSMGKGQAWVNGNSIGRYWPRELKSDGCSQKCDYRGTYKPTKCVTGCGERTHEWYHVPRDWLNKQGKNLLVVLEEVGGDPNRIYFASRKVGSICSHVAESHELTLECHGNERITSIDFASFGNPTGSCHSFQQGDCHANRTLEVLTKACVGRSKCTFSAKWQEFAADSEPCPGTEKSFAVEVLCN